MPRTRTTIEALRARLGAMPGAVAEPYTPPRGKEPLSVIYKVCGKMFAVLSLRGDAFVVLKCDPHLAEILRAQYQGVGSRTHLDKRFWIAVGLDADVPAKEIERLAAHSYEQVCAKLTKKQREGLGGA